MVARAWTSGRALAAPRSRRGSPGAVPGGVSRVLLVGCRAVRARSAWDRSGPALEVLPRGRAVTVRQVVPRPRWAQCAVCESRPVC